MEEDRRDDENDWFEILSDFKQDSVKPFIYMKSGFNYGGEISELTLRYVTILDRKDNKPRKIYLSRIKDVVELR